MIDKEKWNAETDEDKQKSIKFILGLFTHNGVTKDDLLMMLRYSFEKMEEYKEELESLENMTAEELGEMLAGM